jgi:hypothetical protein
MAVSPVDHGAAFARSRHLLNRPGPPGLVILEWPMTIFGIKANRLACAVGFWGCDDRLTCFGESSI